MPLYLGLDCSTQGLTALVLDAGADANRADVVFDRQVVFETALPRYGTRHGVLPSADPHVAVAPPALWAEALDLALGEVAASGLDLSRLAAIAGSAQQHGSVYLTAAGVRRFAALEPARPLVDQLDPRGDVFSRAVSPIWMDTSTTVECAEITRAMGGAARLAALTGSRAFERFTGPQIRRFWKTDPDGYARTARIHLVSSFLASLLAGRDAPLEPGDASGMNLMDLAGARWAPDALEATAPELARRLPAIVPASSIVGPLAPYWRSRHGLPAAAVVVWTGDNPSSLAGTGVVEEGRIAISLGTSDTLFGPMRTPRVDPSGTSHVFGAPTGAFMGLTCVRNGSLARERVRDACGLDWTGFSRALEAAPPGNRGGLMLPWFEPEITPAAPAGVHLRGVDPADVPARVRAVVEGQMMGLANHSRWMGVDVRTIVATGGASANPAILRVMADVFDAEVRASAVTNAAALGAAVRAWHAERMAAGAPLSWTDAARATADPDPDIWRPRPDARGIYRPLREALARFEAAALTAPPAADRS